MDVVEKGVLEKLSTICGRVPSPSDHLALLGIDSMGMAELTFELERHFSIRMDDQILEIDTVSQLVDYVRQHHQRSSQSAKGSEAAKGSEDAPIDPDAASGEG